MNQDDYLKSGRCQLAPNATKRFFELLEQGYYKELKNIFDLFTIKC